MFDIRVDDLSGEATRRLLTQHLQGMQATSHFPRCVCPGKCQIIRIPW